MIDLHCHLLPGVDDGAESPEISLDMAEKLVEIGFEAVCCTPHVPWSTFVHSPEEMARVRNELDRSFDLAGVPLALYRGAEHHSHEVLERAGEDQLITYPRGDTFLMEFPLSGFPARVEDLIFRLQVKGMVPVLAHVERYPEVQRDVGVLESLKERGCYVLINLSSLAGGWDRQSQSTARSVVQAGLADAATTDMHSPRDGMSIATGLDVLEDLVGKEGLFKMMNTLPAEIAGIDPQVDGSQGATES